MLFERLRGGTGPEDLRSCDVAANGDFLMIENFVPPPLSPHINIILNWFEELKQRVPTGR